MFYTPRQTYHYSRRVLLFYFGDMTSFASANVTYSANDKWMYVTIGPQCSGKTSYLSAIPNLIDISMDATPGVYYSLPVSELLNVVCGDNSNTCSNFDTLLNKPVMGRLVRDRLQDDAVREEIGVLCFLMKVLKQ